MTAGPHMFSWPWRGERAGSMASFDVERPAKAHGPVNVGQSCGKHAQHVL